MSGYVPEEVILNTVSDAIVTVDRDNRIIQWNRAATAIYGWEAAEALGKCVHEVIPVLRFLDGSTLTHVQGELRERGAWAGRLVQQHRSGREIVIEGSAQVLRDEHGARAGSVAINRDVTASMEAEAERARLYDEAQEAVRARHEFLSIATHELKSPIAALVGYTQLLESHARADSERSERDRRWLGIVAEQADRLNRLADKLLDLSRIESGTFTIEHGAVDLDALIRRMVEELQPSLERHTLEYLCHDAPVVVVGDQLRLEQVMHNLLGNAIKYSPEGGVVTVRLAREGAEAVLSVSDPGIGIPHEAQTQIFERFYRAPNAETQFSGLGIGLYLAQEILTLHGGCIEVKSDEGAGGTFTVRLPLATTL